MQNELNLQKHAVGAQRWLSAIGQYWFVLLIAALGLWSSLVNASAQGMQIDAGTIPAIPNIYLPLISRAPVPTPVLPTWQQLGGAGLKLSSLAFDQSAANHQQLYVGDLREPSKGGGIYRGKVAPTCGVGQVFERINDNVRVVDIAFNGDNGLVGTFGAKVLYYQRNTDTWQFTPSPMNDNIYSVAFANGNAFAGTDGGVFKSADSGVTWQPLGGPSAINTIQAYDDSLWIGTADTGVHRLLLASHQFLPQNIVGLTDKALQVWDFAFNGDTVFVATANGVYQGTTDKMGDSDAWTPFGRQGALINSLELIDNVLYAGGNLNGVWQKQLATSADWTPVSAGDGWNPNSTVLDLVYQPNLCGGGLFAATDDGIWVYGKHGQ